MRKWSEQLLRYDFWANQELLQHLKTLPQDLFLREMKSVFSTISQTMGHLNSVNQVWLTRMQGGSPLALDPYVFSSLDEAERAFLELKQQFALFLRHDHDVTREVSYKNSKGSVFQQSVFEIIQHLVNHGTYHRGNIAAMIRQSGYQGTSTDYITFLRLGDSVPALDDKG